MTSTGDATTAHESIAAPMTPVAVAYVIASIASVGAEVADVPAVGWVAKAALMPLLLAWLLAAAHRPLSRPQRALAVGLVFAWFGDLLLAIDGDLPFLLGIAAFLVMQLCYIAAFRRVPGPDMVRAWPVAIAPYAFFWLVLVALMLRGGDILAVPASVYGLVLVTMAVKALGLVLRVPRRPGWRVAGGAALFMVSDSLIALTAFAGLTANALTGALIMTTYTIAQAMIVTGFVEATAGLTDVAAA
jgi:uncharacterized membrane protein YhhN